MITLLTLLTLFNAPLPQPAPQDSVEGNLIIRTDDLMHHLEIDFISFDRLSFTSHSQEFGYFGPQPVFMVDGLPIDVSFFGMINPYHLPAANGRVEEKQSGRFFDDPVAGSRFIRLDTGEPEAGLSVYGGVKMSNESGEPGPWVFDPERVTPNIERFGPGIDMEMQLAGDRFYGKGQFRFHRQMNTNISIERRMKGMVSLPEEGEWLRAEAITQSGMLEAGYRTDGMLVRARTVLAESDDFLYFQPLGREIPSRPGLHQAILAADADLSDRWSISSYAQVADKKVGFRRNQFAHEFDWQEQTREIFSALKRQTDNQSLSLGSRYRVISTDASGVDEGSRHYLDLFADIQLQISPAVTAEFDQNITIHSGNPGIRSSAGLEQQMTSSWKSSAQITYSETLPEFANPAADLIQRGYDIDARFGIPLEPFDSPGKTRLITLALSQTLALNNDISLTGRLKHISHFAFHIPFQPVVYDAPLHTMPGLYQLIKNESGRRVGFSFGADHNMSDRFQHRFQSTVSYTTSGTDAYRDFWKQAPNVWLLYSADYSPFPDLDLRAQIRYRSSTRWKEFDAIDGETFRSFNVQYPFSYGTFTSSPPSHLNIDMSAAKWFWNQRVRAVVMMKNLLNRDFYPHPLSVREGFTFVLKGEVRF